jgi:hypothetical protein
MLLHDPLLYVEDHFIDRKTKEHKPVVYTYIKYRKTPGAHGRISLRMSMEEPPNEAGLEDTDDQGEHLPLA